MAAWKRGKYLTVMLSLEWTILKTNRLAMVSIKSNRFADSWSFTAPGCSSSSSLNHGPQKCPISSRPSLGANLYRITARGPFLLQVLGTEEVGSSRSRKARTATSFTSHPRMLAAWIRLAWLGRSVFYWLAQSLCLTLALLFHFNHCNVSPSVPRTTTTIQMPASNSQRQ